MIDTCFKEFCDTVLKPRLSRCIKEFYKIVGNPLGTDRCLHEIIRYELIKESRKSKVYYIGEFQSLLLKNITTKRKDRIDFILSTNDKPFSCAFEIDRKINEKSIIKLRSYPWDVGKCIIFYGERLSIDKIGLLEPDIYCINVSEESLAQKK